jgi:peptide chain release factor 2
MQITIKSGVPQEDSRDFVKMLARMYANSEFGNGEFDMVSKDECRVICSDNAHFGNEYGWHRLVRISPFDEQKRRHTCFAQVEIDGFTRDGKQVCSYIMHPYTMAKNHVTETETSDVQCVLNGKPLGLRKP